MKVKQLLRGFIDATSALPLIYVVAVAVVFAAAGSASATQIPITSVAGFPNERTSNDPPSNAIDGNIATFTWTTEAYNVENPSHLAIGFASTAVNRLRLWKTPEGGGGQPIKDLTIQYTTDAGPLAFRSWTTVTDLTNGFNGTELFQATSVNSNGTVTGDVHDSVGNDGWASLTFDTVTATGIRISFTLPAPAPGCGAFGSSCNHYRVGEFEAHFDTTDQDGDGVPDDGDECPNSDLSPTVVIDTCDSGVPNTVFLSGCTISDLIAKCAEGASKHGQFVSCVSHLTNDLKKAGIITGQQKGAIQSCAAQAHIP
jgi:hypothetical protein